MDITLLLFTLGFMQLAMNYQRKDIMCKWSKNLSYGKFNSRNMLMSSANKDPFEFPTTLHS